MTHDRKSPLWRDQGELNDETFIIIPVIARRPDNGTFRRIVDSERKEAAKPDGKDDESLPD
jgi:hypothetical protein